MSNWKRYYIAYGSNLNVEQMSERCPAATPIGTAILHDYELYFKGSGTGSYLTIEPKIGGKVPVAIWEVTPLDELALDRYEGYPRFYYKQDFTLEVTDLNGEEFGEMECFAYVMTKGRHYGLPTAYYLATCMRGYKNFGFDGRILITAMERTREIL